MIDPEILKSLKLALIEGALPTITALIVLYATLKTKGAVENVHLSINSRMDQFLEEAKKLSKIEGINEERARRK